jgi:hypothetical protein
MSMGAAQYKDAAMLEDQQSRDIKAAQHLFNQEKAQSIPDERPPWMKQGETKPSDMLQDETWGNM